MMGALEVLDKLREHGVTPVLEGSRLYLEPGSLVPEELMPEVRAHKAAIVDALSERKVAQDTGLAPLLARLRNGQAWLTEHYDAYMDDLEPEGPYVASLEAWGVLEKLLRRLYGYEGCIHGRGGRCPSDAPAICTYCAEREAADRPYE